MFSALTSSIEHINAGTLRALAVTTAMRAEILPHLPAVAEFLPGYEDSNWCGFGAPQNTPAEIIAKLNKELNAGLADRKVKARLSGARRRGAAPAGRFRQAHLRGNREMGQGDPDGRHQARIARQRRGARNLQPAQLAKRGLS
jgi:hypothetical protein